MKKIVLDSDIKYNDGRGNLLRNNTELTLSKLLSFLEHQYEYDSKVLLDDGSTVTIDFKIDKKYIEVLESKDDIEKFKKIKKIMPSLNLIAIGNSKSAAKLQDLNTLAICDSDQDQTGSIFIEDPSLAFDYAHILPLVEKCSILHGHTSTVMVEIIGKMVNNLVIDFAEAKRIIRETLSDLDHKFFINKKYIVKEDNLHYYVSFEGPKGFFSLQLPKSTTFTMPGEATVENLSSVIVKLLSSRMPSNIEAIGVYVYEGVNKGAHILSNIK